MRYLLTFIFLFAAAGPHRISGTVTDVHDGDTITMLLECSRLVHIRLASIDCPELHQQYGYTARRRVKNLTYGKQLQIDSLGKDRYGRIIALVILPNGDTLNHTLVREGLAWQYTKYDSSARLYELEQQARNNHTGLWKYNATPPWEWRHKE